MTDELLQLLNLGQLTELDRTVDSQCAVLQGFYQPRVSGFEDGLNVANIARTNTRHVTNELEYDMAKSVNKAGNTWYVVADTSAASEPWGNIHAAGQEAVLSGDHYLVNGRSLVVLLER